MKDIRNYSLLGHNTFGIDACCRRFVEYASVEEAQQIVASLSEADEPLLLWAVAATCCLHRIILAPCFTQPFLVFVL